MTEQIEDEFWAEERARAAAARGQHADPAACGACRDRVAAGGQVQHDECAQRALLLPAPDAPGYEVITGMSEEEVWALPARFHIPVFMESSTPKAWVCAVCWGDGWSTMWPCKTAVDQGLRVFTAEDYAETRAKWEAAELAEHRAEATTPLVVARFDTAMEHAREELPGLTVGAIAENGRPVALVFDPEARVKVAHWLTPVIELEEQLAEMTRCRDNALRALNRDDVDTDPHLPDLFADGLHDLYEWETQPEPDQAPAELVDRCVRIVRPAFGKLTQEREQALARVAELEAELGKYVGHEPTIADEMAYLSRCLDAVHDVCNKAEQQATGWENPLPVPEWVTTIRTAADGLREQTAPRLALPWAAVMPDDELHLFLDDLVSAALNRWQTDQDGPIPDRVTLAEVEKACARWRTPGQGLRGDEPNVETPERTYPPAMPWAALMDDEDLQEFLAELAGVAVGRSVVPNALDALTEVEDTCGRWRAIAEAQHAHNTAPGPDTETGDGRG